MIVHFVTTVNLSTHHPETSTTTQTTPEHEVTTQIRPEHVTTDKTDDSKPQSQPAVAPPGTWCSYVFVLSP